ncbi:HlyD family secretion protein [Aeromonas taiwanensis]|uniref:HlyD family secretion protein n=1 Tax=Aeromonas taiwanensis TaxID=633417 RepID=A0A5F0KBS2_9GAMM|nr:HlyD family secretion protein [Aeromonas taiwanensis]TFF77220.1 HlyD family secretion protein [Aeromonas taiwanensis]TFF77912.1 HlyD family secretion protein [Aeromonas taiwanensis]TFF81684.1 HlyD family secretion protein [Aeromonas taiwanensis]
MTHDSPSSPRPAANRRRTRLLLLVVVPALVLLGAGAIYLQGGRYVETDNAYVKADKVPISTEVLGRVAKVFVDENQQVKAGQPLFELDPESFRVAVTKAEAELAKVRTDLVALQTSYRGQQAEIAVARTRHAYAVKEEHRQADLVAKHFTSTANYDDARQLTIQTAQQQVALEEGLKKIEASLSGDVNLPVEQQPAYREAAAGLAKARLDLARTTVYAPANGVASQLPKPGQYMIAGMTAMMLVETDTPWVEANFTETELTHVQPGQRVDISVDTYPDAHWTGVVESLSPATGSEFSVIPAQNATGNWVKIAQRVAVRIKLDTGADLPTLRAGLSAIAEIDTGHQRSLPGWSSRG